MKLDMWSHLRTVVFLGLWLLLSGVTCDNTCNSPTPDSYPALCLLVLDKATGEVITNATVQANNGQTTETLPRGIDDPVAYFAVERGGDVGILGYCGVSETGMYTIIVSAEGYETAQVTEVHMLDSGLERVPVLPVDLLVELDRDEAP